MATIATRLYSTGVYAVNGEFDEFTGVPIVDSSLQLWLDAGQSSSYPGTGATWTDLSGNGKNYTLTNGPTYSSSNGGIITFAGASSQYATSAATLFNSTTFNTYTMNLWAFPTGAGNFVQVNGQSTPNTAYHYSAIEISAAGVIKFGQWIGGYGAIATSTQSLNAWYNLVITYNGTTATAYVNGVSVGSTNIIWSSPGANTFMALMAIDTTNMGTGAYASGSLGAFMVYNRGLTADEVTTNYNALAGRFGRTVVGRARSRITANTVQATEFDEVTYNNSTSFAKRENVNGNVQITGIFDELTSAPIVDSSLVYWLDAGQTASYPGSGTTATDLSGQAVTSTLTGNVEYSSFNAGYLTFDGNHDYITTSSEFANANYLFADANGAWTVNTWFQFSKAPTTTRTGNQAYMVVGRGGGIATGATFGIFVGSASDTTYGSYAPHRIGVVSRGTVNIISNSSANTGAWNNATVTWDGTTGNIYYNGSFVNTLNTSVAAVLQTYNVAIGTQANSASTFIFEGNISTVSIYNRSLSADEVAQNFNALRRRYNV